MLLSDKFVPTNTTEALAALAVGASFVNIGGGFLVTERMLELFRRPTDPPEHMYLMAIPGAAMVGGVGFAALNGIHDPTLPYLAASTACISSIACLSSQKTARLGNALGIMGVSTGIAATLSAMQATPECYAQAAALSVTGGAIGAAIAKRMAITDLPQLVAAFHSLVGAAAVAASVGSYMGDPSPDLLHTSAAFAGTLIGAVTLTGSMVAFGKLQGIMASAPMNLPGKNLLNVGMGLGNVACGAALLTTADPATGVAALAGTTALSSALGWHMTASIGAPPPRARPRLTSCGVPSFRQRHRI